VNVLFLGTPGFATPSLEAILDSRHLVQAVLTPPDRPRGRSGTPRPCAVKGVALAHGIPVMQPGRVNDPATYGVVRELSPDVAVVVAFGRILSGRFLELPRHGCLNVHASLLPAYRGAAPIQWALVHGEVETGVTTMQLDEGMDTGDILLQRRTTIDPGETAVELAARLARLGAALIVETLDQLEEGTLEPTPQPAVGVSRAPLLRPEDGRIEWDRDAATIVNLVRGLQPWPLARTRAGAGPMRVFRALPAEGREAAAPGTVLGPEGDGARVACGAGGAVALLEIQPASRRRMSGREALNGRMLRAGELLG
jgi:methionyl-tRNA formyltransferase